MTITVDEVERIAHLARLEFDPDAAPHHAAELTGILALVEQMNAVDTEGVEPMAHPLDAAQRLRADEVTEPDLHERYQACAPAVADGLYLVPRVIE